MKHRIEIPAMIVVDGVPYLGELLVVHVEADAPKEAIERLAHAIEKLTASTARRSRARPSARSSDTTKPTSRVRPSVAPRTSRAR